jgi:hypothetical protein
MPALHALLVAINNYPNPAHRLGGCINDLEQVKACLETCCAALGLDLKARTLTDDQATRANVIEAFAHFNTAADDDPCLFFYAGHGARSAAPQAFWHLEPDHKNDSIVCHDSRTPGGRDLMDKELSYLIWKANEGKSQPFVSITDCCHSGTLRDWGKEMPITVRQVQEIGEGLDEGGYIGIEHYKRSANGELSPPQGRRVHLAAARDAETAKEVQINGKPRGIFSHFLIETLRQRGPVVDYHELMSRVQMRVRGNIADQSPQLWAAHQMDKQLGFLSSAGVPKAQTGFVGFDKNKGWTLNVGAIHGLQTTADGNISLKIPELSKSVSLSEILPTFSKVQGMQEEDIKKTYTALILKPRETKVLWQQHLDNNNPYSQITDEAISMKLFQVLEPHNLSDDVPTAFVSCQNAPAVFRYTDGKKERPPAFQLKISNTGQHPLWCSLLYFGWDYSISNALLPKQMLAPGEEVWAREVFEGHLYKSIPLQISAKDMANRVTQITEFLKMIVCTDELDTDLLCQPGINADPSPPLRHLGLALEKRQRDWKAWTIRIQIVI